ncbi:S-layer family protein [Aneurinibacillus soli]|uniref:Uncharacterized protein n=1 Tax=Aneurinibacillus soli TaxID=1500254 RepID=A0A0U5B011_9BACL|nr:YcdB/YcdC domain-containing protein [Aneurinibacillus soli]PYE59924.1 S-layer family protein [Aneurinibacillus soli]BAU29354.1 hypothetical protein CB4_03554 [Aneurinibacillus soli]
MGKREQQRWTRVVIAGVILAGGMLPYNVMAQEVKADSASVSTARETDTAIKREQAIQKAKQIVSIPDSYKEERVELDTNNYTKRTQWNLSWQSNAPEEQGGITVSIDASDGTLVSIQRWSSQDGQASPLPPTWDYEKVIEDARSLVKKQYGSYASNLRLNAESEKQFRSNTGGQFFDQSLYFERIEDGVPVVNQGLRLSYDRKGNVRYLDFSWDKKLAFEKGQVKSKEEILKNYTDKLQMEVAYLPNTDRPNGKVELAYVPSVQLTDSFYGTLPTAVIDARTGKPLDINTGLESGYTIQSATPLSSTSVSVPTNLKLDADQAIARARQMVQVDDKMEVQNKSYREETMPYKRKIWDISWQAKDGMSKYTGATVDAETGEVIRTNVYGMSYDMKMRENAAIKVNVTQQQAQAKAEEYVRRAVPGRLSSLYTASVTPNLYNNDPDKILNYSVTFMRKEKDVRVIGEGAWVTIDAETGDVTDYNLNGFKQPLPEIKNVISAQQAKEKVVGFLKAELNYLAPNPYNPSDGKNSRPAKLMYTIGLKDQQSPFPYMAQYMDARTGEWKVYGNQPVNNTGLPVQDIKGHALEKELQKIIEANLIEVKDGKLNPDQKLTRGELMNLVRSMHRYMYNYYPGVPNPTFSDVGEDSEYSQAVEWSVQQRLLKKEAMNFDPNGAATREFIAEIVVRGLGYDKLAEIDGVFDLPFADAASMKHKGYAALVKRLHIMNTDVRNEFEPERQVTKAEAAVILYRYLQVKDKVSGQ